MILKTRPVAIATGALALLAAGLIGYQIAKSPASEPEPSGGSRGGGTSDSGRVTPAIKPPAPLAITEAPSQSVQPAAAPAAASAVASAATPSTKPPPAPAATRTAAATATTTTTATKPRIKHPVAAPSAALPAMLPNEVDGAVAKALGRKGLTRHFYLDPLARRFVASVDNLGRRETPTDLWLLRPAPGELQRIKSSRQPDTSLLRKANSQRYASFVRWVEATDTVTLISLYQRMYPLLQQTYVELGHTQGYFNDRLIEVIDQLLATPTLKAPLRVKQVNADAPSNPGTPAKPPRFEFVNPEIEALSNGQKMLLRTGPQNMARLKIKLKALRQGLVKLAP